MSTDVAKAEPAPTLRVAAEIRAQMGRLNVNRAEVARRLEVENSWVGKRLNGQTEISVTDLYRIAAALQVEVADLIPRDSRGAGTTRSYVASKPGMFPMPDHPIIQMSTRIPIQSKRTAPTGR